MFVNGLLIPGSALDATRLPEANGGLFCFFSPSLYEFDRQGPLLRIFEVPALLVPNAGGNVILTGNDNDYSVTLPTGFSLLPGALHSYRISPADLGTYVNPGTKKGATSTN